MRRFPSCADEIGIKSSCDFRRGLNTDHDGFGCRRHAFFGDAAERYERVGFRKIGRRASQRDRVWHDDKSKNVALAVVELADQVDDLADFMSMPFNGSG